MLNDENRIVKRNRTTAVAAAVPKKWLLNASEYRYITIVTPSSRVEAVPVP
ncbi:hypothetical protein D3C73_1457860 [compost metagenome]